MKIYDKIIQGTDEWKEIKYRKIGSTRNKEVMANEGKNVENNAVFFELLSEFMEDFDPFVQEKVTFDMLRGNEFEPLACDEFERIYGKKCYQIGWAEIDDFRGISPDRLVGIRSNNPQEALEVKCPSKNTYSKYLLDNSLIMTDYAWQIVQYFVVFKELKTLYFFVYRPENNIQNHILLEINLDTEIKVNAKKSGTVRNLVVENETRAEQLRIKLNEKIKHLSNQKNKQINF